MKPIILTLLAALIFACTFSSCKKEYRCTCTNGWTLKQDTFTLHAYNVNDARNTCEINNNSGIEDGEGDCHLQ